MSLLRKKIVVFGGTGALARAFVRLAINDNEIWASYRDEKKIYEKNKINWFKYDASTSIDMVNVSKNHFDAILNFIGSRYEDSAKHPEKYDVSSEDNVRVLLHIASRINGLLKTNGSFLNVSSIAAFHASEEEFSYGLSKATGIAVVEQLQRLHYRKYRITNICPGAIKTPLVAGREDFENFIEPQEVGKLLLFLINNTSSFSVPEIKLFRSF